MTMSDFLVIYQGGDSSWRERSASELEAVMQAWGQWFKQLEPGQSRYVDSRPGGSSSGRRQTESFGRA
jgi:hypothetical protein